MLPIRTPERRGVVGTGDAATSYPTTRLAQILDQLADYYELGHNRSAVLGAAEAISRESVPAVFSSRDRSFSAINGNGVPFQISVSLGTSVPALRILGEVGTPSMSMPQRLNATSLRLREIVGSLALVTAAPAINHSLRILLPRDPRQTLAWTGGIWIGVAADSSGAVRLRLYVNQRWGSPLDRDRRLAELLTELGAAGSQQAWLRLAPHLRAAATLYGAAIDVTPTGIGRVKLYFACEGATASYWQQLIAQLGLGEGLAQVAGLAGICGSSLAASPTHSLLPSLELPVAAGEPKLKVDISCNHFRTSDVDVERRLIAYAAARGLDVSEYAQVRALVAPDGLDPRRVARIQYCGLGLEREAQPRLNVYFSPDLT